MNDNFPTFLLSYLYVLFIIVRLLTRSEKDKIHDAYVFVRPALMDAGILNVIYYMMIFLSFLLKLELFADGLSANHPFFIFLTLFYSLEVQLNCLSKSLDSVQWGSPND